MKRARSLITLVMVLGVMALLPATAHARTRTAYISSSQPKGIPIEVDLNDSVGTNSISVPGGLTFGGTPFVPGPINLHLSGKASGVANIDLFRGSLSIIFTSIDIKSSSLAIGGDCPKISSAPLAIRQDPAKPSTGTSSIWSGQVSATLNVIARTNLVLDSTSCGGGIQTSNYSETKLSTPGTGSMKIQLGIGPGGTIIIGSMKITSTTPGVSLTACTSFGPATDPCPAGALLTFDPATVTTKIAGKVGIPL